MEASMGILLILGFLVFVMFFKRSLRKVAKYADDVVTTNISEGMAELIERSQEAHEEIINQCGENYLTPSEMYDKIQHRRQKKNQGLQIVG